MVGGRKASRGGKKQGRARKQAKLRREKQVRGELTSLKSQLGWSWHARAGWEGEKSGEKVRGEREGEVEIFEREEGLKISSVSFVAPPNGSLKFESEE
jgi:hypothetical protein